MGLQTDNTNGNNSISEGINDDTGTGQELVVSYVRELIEGVDVPILVDSMLVKFQCVSY